MHPYLIEVLIRQRVADLHMSARPHSSPMLGRHRGRSRSVRYRAGLVVRVTPLALDAAKLGVLREGLLTAATGAIPPGRDARRSLPHGRRAAVRSAGAVDRSPNRASASRQASRTRQESFHTLGLVPSWRASVATRYT